MTQDTEDVVERVARALCRVTGADPDALGVDGSPRWKGWAQFAIPAIEASDRQSLSDRIDGLEGRLRVARTAIATLDEDALGRDREHGYPYRDELLADIDTTLRAALHQECYCF